MAKLKKSFPIVLLISSILFSCFATVALASGKNQRSELKYFIPIADKSVHNYKRIYVSLSGQSISDPAYLINEVTYVPLRSISEISGATVGFDPKERVATVKMTGLEATVTDGGYVVYANERPLLSKTPSVILSDGKMYIPVRVMAKILSLSVEWQAPNKVTLAGQAKPLLHGNHFYKSDDLYWLSRIISAESRGESLLGQISVGSVVLNRVRSKDYPNNIYGVVFDRKYGVQFSPVADGSIYMTPTYNSVQAAKICLEGTSVSDSVLFFLAPRTATSTWITENRKYAFTVGNHHFFY